MRILLHPGFPKTGSSTFQYGLFLPLEQQGHVDLRMWRKDNPREPLDERPSSRLFMDKEMLPKSLDYAAPGDKLCVLSDESFTAPLRLRRNNFGAHAVDPLQFPVRIRDQLRAQHPGAVIDVLVVLRNQTDLLLSQFVEEYNLVTYKNVNILFDESGNVDVHGYKIYEFATYIEVLQETFGRDHVTVLAFEQWREDPAAFYAHIARVMQVPLDLVTRHLGTAHLNRKEKRADGYLTRNGTLVPFLTPPQRAAILAAFRASNLRLAAHGFDARTLARYGYL